MSSHGGAGDGGASGLNFKDEGAVVGSSATLNVVGAGAQVVMDGLEAKLNVGGASGVLEVDKDGARIDDASILDYLGNGVDVDVTGGIAALAWPQVVASEVMIDQSYPLDSDTFNQYNTVAAGITKAIALAAAGPVTVLFKKGIYVEEGIVIPGSNYPLTLEFEPGAIFTGAVTPADQIFNINGAGAANGPLWIKGFNFRPAGNTGTYSVFKVTSGSQVMFDGIAWEMRIEDYKSRKSFIEGEDGVWGQTSRMWGRNIFTKCYAIQGVVNLSGYWECDWQNSSFWAYGKSSSYGNVHHVNGALPFAVNCHYFTNCAFGPGPRVVHLDSNINYWLNGTFVDYSDSYILSGEQGGNNDAESILQSAVKDAGSQATVNWGMNILNAGVKNNAYNSMLIASQVKLELQLSYQDYRGFYVEDYDDAIGIDVANCNGLQPDYDAGYVDLHDDQTVDDFESYADTTALNAVWGVVAAGGMALTLGGGVGQVDGKYMNISFGPTSDDGYAYRTGSWNIRDMGVIAFDVRGTGAVNIITLKAQLVDGTGKTATGPEFTLVPDDLWVEKSYTIENFTLSAAEFDWDDIAEVRFRALTSYVTGSGSWSINNFHVHKDEVWTPQTVIDPMTSLTGWTAIAGSAPVLVTGLGIHGGDAVRVDFANCTGIYKTGTWNFGIDPVAFHAKVKLESGFTPGNGINCILMMYDGTRWIWMDGPRSLVVGGVGDSENGIFNADGNKWKSLVWFVSDGITNGTSFPGGSHGSPLDFNFANVQQVRIYANFRYTQGTVLFNDLEEGLPGMIVTDAFQQATDVVGQILAHSGYNLSSIFRQDWTVATNTSLAFNWNLFSTPQATARAFLGLWPYEHQSEQVGHQNTGEGMLGEWLDSTISATDYPYMRMRMCAKGRLRIVNSAQMWND